MTHRRSIVVLPFTAGAAPQQDPSAPCRTALSRMIALVLAEKLDLCPELDARFFPLVATIEGKRTWAVPGRPWTEKNASDFLSDECDPDVLVFGDFTAAREYNLVASAFDARGRFTRFRKSVSGPLEEFLNDLETLLLDMAQSLGACIEDVNLRRALGRFGTRDWRAFRAFLLGRSNEMSCSLNLPLPDSRASFDPFVEAFSRDDTFQEAAEELALFALEVVLGEKGEAGAAVKAAQRAAKVFPDDFKLHGALGFCYRKLGYRQDAQLAWERCLKLDTERHSVAETLFQLGCLLEESGDFAAARLRYEAALCQEENHCDAHDRLAFSLANLGDLDGAINHWTRVIELDPARQATYGHLGWALEEKGEIRQARQNYEKGLQGASPVWNVYFHYATFLVRNDEPRRALGVLEKARKALGEAAWIHERMGAIYLVLGDERNARTHLRAAARMDPSGDFGKSAACALARLGGFGRVLHAFLSRLTRAFRRVRPGRG